MRVTVLFVLLLAGASALRRVDVDDAKNRPVTKVVTLLKDMSTQLEKEGEEDEEVYDKMVCWCESNDKEKTKAIADAEAHIVNLDAFIEEMRGLSGRLSTEINTLNKEVAENTDALDKASDLREKELAEFTQQETDQLASIAALKNAVNTLAKHNSLAQQSDEEQASLRAVLRHSMKHNSAIIEQMLLPSQKRVISGFLQSSEDGPQNAGSYAPQSGAIFGVLKNMKESFEANLASSQKEEQESSKAFEELKAAKTHEINAGTKQIEKKTGQMAEADEKRAQASQDRSDTANTLAADQEFLANLKGHCANMDAEMEMRTKTRTEEIGAISKALSVLTNDDAHDLFTKTFGFVQKTQTVKSDRREAVAKLLTAAGHAAKNPKLIAIALRARLDAFGKVKETLDKMIHDLTKEKEDEIALKDWCISEIQKNERTTELTDREKEGHVANIADLTERIDTLASEIEGLNGEVSQMQTELKRAGEDREAENRAFQQTVSDQRATADLLTKALGVLKGFYDKPTHEEALVQKGKQPAGAPPPAGFKSYKKNAQSGGVMGMLQQIINDSEAMEKDALKGELDAQTAYESFVTETNAAIETARKSIRNKEDAKAKAEGDKTEANVNLDNTMDNLESLSKENMDIHGNCDYTLKNYDVKQASRDSEIEALKQSVAILSGAKFGGFLQFN